MKRFGTPIFLPVRAPFRLDLTADALRRLASNVVDVVDADGTYYRALSDDAGTELVAIRSADAATIELRATGRRPHRWTAVVARMLGTQIDLSQWHARTKRDPWLARLARLLRGVKPPRYPTLWEACAHAILFQQISIHAAAAIMRRAVEALGERLEAPGVACVAFPGPWRWLEASDEFLRGAGVSANKIAHLKNAAQAIASGALSEAHLDTLPTHEAAAELLAIRGIGAWSAAVVLLRGMGRLDTFPMRDSGVARSLALLSGDERLDQAELLERLGDLRGMLYYHLLLGRVHNLVAR